MMYFLKRKKVVRIAEYIFREGHCGRKVLDQNNMLILRVVDDGYIFRYKQTQEHLLWLQQASGFSLIKDFATRLGRKNSRLLRECLIRQLEIIKVHLRELDLQEGEYHFRPVQSKEVIVLKAFLEQPHSFSVTLLEGNDPSVKSLPYLGNRVVV